MSKDQIRNYLLEHSPDTSVRGIGDDDSLLDAGVIDSLAMVDLITFLETTFQIPIDEDDLTPENFDTLNAIVHFVTAKQGTA